MELIYIYHSGFAVMGKKSIVIIDFWEDTTDALHGIVHDELLQQKDRAIYVLSTHFHPDHFNKEILMWRQQAPNIHYILSKDILRHKRARIEEGTFIKKGETFDDGNLRVKAFGSTDSGVSFYLELEGVSLFHAGDLNYWGWIEESTPQEVKKAEGDYLGELRDIRKEISKVDVAMFPIDRRMGKGYPKGAQQFLNTIKTTIFVPMHFGTDYEGGNSFKSTAEQAGCTFCKIERRGQCFDLTELSKQHTT